MDARLEAEILLAEKMLMDTVNELINRGVKQDAILINMVSAASAFAIVTGMGRDELIGLVKLTFDGKKRKAKPGGRYNPNDKERDHGFCYHGCPHDDGCTQEDTKPPPRHQADCRDGRGPKAPRNPNLN